MDVTILKKIRERKVRIEEKEGGRGEEREMREEKKRKREEGE